MGQSLSQMYVHLTFGTKYRKPIIKEEHEKQIHGYMAGILKNMESPALIINSVPDHVHILFRLSKNFALAKVVEEVKKQSSKWIKGLAPCYKNFSWQIGYGAFSVSSSKVKSTIQYIEKQKERHWKFSYKEEIEMYTAQNLVSRQGGGRVRKIPSLISGIYFGLLSINLQLEYPPRRIRKII